MMIKTAKPINNKFDINTAKKVGYQTASPVVPEKPDLIYGMSGTNPEQLREQGRPISAF